MSVQDEFLTATLAQGGETKDAREIIIKASQTRYGDHWLRIIHRRLPMFTQRAEDADDVLQQSLMVLDRRLELGCHGFVSGKDIFRWMCAVVDRKAMKAFGRAARMKGPSVFCRNGLNNNSLEPNAALVNRVEGENFDNSTPSRTLQERDLADQIFALNTIIDNELAQVESPQHQSILRFWLNGVSYREIAEKLWGDKNKNHWTIKATTFRFKKLKEIARVADPIRMEYRELDQQTPRLLDQLISHLMIAHTMNKTDVISILQRPAVILADEREELK